MSRLKSIVIALVLLSLGIFTIPATAEAGCGGFGFRGPVARLVRGIGNRVRSRVARRQTRRARFQSGASCSQSGAACAKACNR